MHTFTKGKVYIVRLKTGAVFSGRFTGVSCGLIFLGGDFGDFARGHFDPEDVELVEEFAEFMPEENWSDWSRRVQWPLN